MLRDQSSKPLQLTLGYVYLFSYGEVPYSLHSETLLDPKKLMNLSSHVLGHIRLLPDLNQRHLLCGQRS